MRITLAVLMGLGSAQAAQAGCRLALVLALDVSASVDAEEYRLQQQGTAAALMSEPVQRALFGFGDTVAIAAFDWSGPLDQTLIADWQIIDSPAALNALAATIAGHPRSPAVSRRTATGSALLYAADLLARQPGCDRKVVDIATDGTFNAGPAPEMVRHLPVFLDTTINALAVAGSRVPDWRDVKEAESALQVYLTHRVIHGPGAFVERAADYRDFERAMGRKLERELQGIMIGAVEGGGESG